MRTLAYPLLVNQDQTREGRAMVTTVSIRLALRKLAEVTCGTAPSLIRVTARVAQSGRIYSAAIPWEYRDEVCKFLRQQLGSEIPVQTAVIVLTEEQARAVVALAMSSNRQLTEQLGDA
jgi:hypothetical protein